jgi:hypothetical protein
VVTPGGPRRATPVPSRGKTGSANSSGAARRRAARAQQRQRRQLLLTGGAIALVIVVVAVFVIIKVTGGAGSPSSPGASSSIDARVAVPAAVYERYTSAASPSALAAAAANFDTKYPDPTPVDDAPLTKTGKPDLLYIGAEYCPYCATERWALILALSKFGTFSGLSEIHSSPTDEYPSTPTWSFYGSHYTSPYLTFTPVEVATVSGKPLQSLDSTQQALYKKHASGYPFVYFNGKAMITAVGYNPQLLHGLSFGAAVDSVAGGTSTLASNVYSAAGAIVSDICRMTGGKSAAVCKEFPKPITSS